MGAPLTYHSVRAFQASIVAHEMSTGAHPPTLWNCLFIGSLDDGRRAARH
jgi:hypothetical protein